MKEGGCNIKANFVFRSFITIFEINSNIDCTRFEKY